MSTNGCETEASPHQQINKNIAKSKKQKHRQQAANRWPKAIASMLRSVDRGATVSSHFLFGMEHQHHLYHFSQPFLLGHSRLGNLITASSNILVYFFLAFHIVQIQLPKKLHEIGANHGVENTVPRFHSGLHHGQPPASGTEKTAD